MGSATTPDTIKYLIQVEYDALDQANRSYRQAYRNLIDNFRDRVGGLTTTSTPTYPLVANKTQDLIDQELGMIVPVYPYLFHYYRGSVSTTETGGGSTTTETGGSTTTETGGSTTTETEGSTTTETGGSTTETGGSTTTETEGSTTDDTGGSSTLTTECITTTSAVNVISSNGNKYVLNGASSYLSTIR